MELRPGGAQARLTSLAMMRSRRRSPAARPRRREKHAAARRDARQPVDRVDAFDRSVEADRRVRRARQR